jgi:hypothetical protein
MIASRATGKFPGDKGDWGMETSFQSFDVSMRRLVSLEACVRLCGEDGPNYSLLSVSAHRERKIYPILTAFPGRKRTRTQVRSATLLHW